MAGTVGLFGNHLFVVRSFLLLFAQLAADRRALRLEQGFDGTPANIDADVLVSAVRKVAAALLSRHWPAEGSRHHAFLALAGVLARGEWTLEDARTFHRVIYRCL